MAIKKFTKNRADGDDLLGDAYEYLMRNFAVESGKSKGQFLTPAEVSIVKARILRVFEVRQAGATAYDPTCGSGSLLLKINDEAGGRITLYGQEKDAATTVLAAMNMILHKKGKEKDKGWSCDLIPKPLIVARYFAEEQSALDALNTELETLSARMAELEASTVGKKRPLLNWRR